VNAKKICVIHLNQIGDLVFSLPLLKALREHFPDAVIHSIVKPYLRELLIGSPYVDRVIPRASRLTEKLPLLQQIRRNRYDLLVSLSESEECLLLTALSGAKTKVGFSHSPWDFCLDVKENVEGHHGWYNNRKLLQRLNIEVRKDDYVGLLTPDEDDCDVRLPEKFVVICAGTSPRRRVKAWNEEKFARLILLLKERHDLTPVLVGGKADQETHSTIVSIAQEKSDTKAFDILDLSGEVGFKHLCSIIRRARLFAGIDSGLMHLAAAMDIPVVGIFGPTDPFYVGPQNETSIVVREEGMPCVPCYLKGCKDRQCMNNLGVDKVLQACEQLLIGPA